MLTLEATARGLYQVVYNSRALYSQYNIESGVKKLLPPPSEHTLYLIASPLLGYGLKEWLAKLPAGSYALAYEAEPQLTQITHQHFAGWQTSQVTLLNSIEYNSLNKTLFNLYNYNFKEVVMLKINGGYYLKQTIYDNLFIFLQQLLQQQTHNRLLLKRNAKRWLKNTIDNFSSIKSFVKPQFDDKPLIIAAAGLSLDEAIPSLKKYRPYYHLLAVDTAFLPLQAHSLNPDALFILEGGFYNSYDFIGHKNFTAPVISDLASYAPLLHNLPAPKSFFVTNIAPVTLFKRLSLALQLPLLPPLGNVAMAAITYALQYSNASIILCGFDFCYSLSRLHAKAAYSHSNDLITNHRLNRGHLTTTTLNRPLLCAQIAGQSYLSDEVLLSYYHILAKLKNERLFSWQESGLPLNLPLFNRQNLKTKANLTWQEVEVDLTSFKENEIENLKLFLKNQVFTDKLDYLLLEAQNTANLAQLASYYLKLWQQS
ncbi:MAG: DUF115 domain-containing protein [Spirochaetaceae bacterium]|nr:DUF115 domain-containing protein [Spirochaetaceae bacterium]